jgi:MFS family permease
MGDSKAANNGMSDQVNSWDRYSLKQRRMVLLCALIGTLVFWGDRSMVSPILPRVAGDLNGVHLYSWVPTAYMLAAAIAAPIWGKLSDIFGRRTIYLWLFSLALAGFVGCATASTYVTVIVMRTVAGMGIGGIQGLNFTLIGTFFAPDERGKMAGTMGFIYGGCALGAPVLSGVITDHFGWRYSMLVGVPVCLAGILMCLAFLPNVRLEGVRKKLDYLGMVLLAAGTVPCVVGFSWAGSAYPWTSGMIIGLFSLSVVSFTLFYQHERRVAGYALIGVELFKNRAYMCTCLVSIFMAYSITAVATYLPMFCQGVQGMSTTTFATVGIPASLITIFTGYLAGYLLDKTGHYKWLLIVATASGVIVCFTISQLTATVTIVALMAIRVGQQLFGAGFMPMINPLAAIAPLRQEQHAVGAGTVNFMSSLGNSLCPAILGSVLNASYAESLAKNTADLQPLLNAGQLKMIATSRILLHAPSLTAFKQSFGGNTELYNKAVEAVRLSLHQTVSTVFLVAAGCVCISLAMALLVKEAPIPKGKKFGAARGR